MGTRFVCSCGMVFSVERFRPNRPVTCPVCGAAQEHEVAPAVEPEADHAADPDRPTIRCRDCGALNSAEEAICGLCGARLGVDASLLAGGVSAQVEAAVAAGEVDTTLVGEESPRKPLRYEGELRVPMIRLILRMLARPRKEMETLVSFLSYRDMVWKLSGLFLLGVAGLWLAAWRFPGLLLVRGFTFGAGVQPWSEWYMLLGMAFSAAALVIGGLTVLAAVAGLLTGHGWHVSALALAFMFTVSLVNVAHFLLLPAALLGGETAADILAWGLLAWTAALTIFVVNKVLDCDPVLSFIIALVICAVTVHFYHRVYHLAERVLPRLERVEVRYRPGER